jgi:hypothetical protein
MLIGGIDLCRVSMVAAVWRPNPRERVVQKQTDRGRKRGAAIKLAVVRHGFEPVSGAR